MNWLSAFFIYFILWWLAFIATLPFGVRTLQETGELEVGQAPSAPSQPLMFRKGLIAAIIAALCFGALYLVVIECGLTLDDLNFLNPPTTW